MFVESDYLKQLVEENTPMAGLLRNNEGFTGNLEYCDAHFIRLTRKQGLGHMREIKYLSERPKTAS